MSNFLKQIRWQQRYNNFEKSYQNLNKFIQKKDFNELERAGIISFFEMTFELSWKTLKDYLEAEGVQVNTPRETIKQAFSFKIINEGDIWLDALEKRNLLTHTYQEDTAIYALSLIKNKYYILFEQLISFLKPKKFENEKYGFSLDEYLNILTIFTNYKSIQSVSVFGSRAMGNFKPESDVDFCLYGNIDKKELSEILTCLNEKSNLPYQFDVLVYSQIENESLKRHIDMAGISLYNYKY